MRPAHRAPRDTLAVLREQLDQLSASGAVESRYLRLDRERTLIEREARVDRRQAQGRGDGGQEPGVDGRVDRVPEEAALDRVVDQGRLGLLLYAPVDVVLSNIDVVEPDLVFISAARLAIVGETHVQGAPDLVVEILSPSTRRRDEITKRHLYEQHGVPEYWVVDPELDAIKVYRLGEGGYRREAELTLEAGDELTSPAFPGLRVPLGEIFR